MKQFEAKEINEVIESVNYRPAISIILPMEPRIGMKSELSRTLKAAADKVEKMIIHDYPTDAGSLVMQKLRTLIDKLEVDTQKKSIAIFISPSFEKVIFLDIPVEESIQVSDKFQIRDLVYAKKQMQKYLVLLLSSNECNIYLGSSVEFEHLQADSIQSVSKYINEVPERVANFSDMSERKEVLMDKYLKHIDDSLDQVLHTYPLPLFVAGTPRITGHFGKLTKHAGAVIGYVQGNYEEAEADELKKVLEPHVRDWRQVMQRDLLNRLEDAFSKNKLAAGIRNVWKEAMNNKGRLLVVEKDYVFPALHGNKKDEIHEITAQYQKHAFIQDAVDKIIEKVFESGGDVEFVDEGLLKDYGHIALIQYY